MRIAVASFALMGLLMAGASHAAPTVGMNLGEFQQECRGTGQDVKMVWAWQGSAAFVCGDKPDVVALSKNGKIDAINTVPVFLDFLDNADCIQRGTGFGTPEHEVCYEANVARRVAKQRIAEQAQRDAAAAEQARATELAQLQWRAAEAERQRAKEEAQAQGRARADQFVQGLSALSKAFQPAPAPPPPVGLLPFPDIRPRVNCYTTYNALVGSSQTTCN